MSRIACVAAPRICRFGARNERQGIFGPLHLAYADTQMAERAPTVLVVDDNESMRKLIVADLTQGTTLRVEQASTGAEALTKAVSPECAVVVLDMMLPDTDGLQFIDRLRELRPDLPAWLQAALGRAIASDPAERFRDMGEFAVEMEAGPARAPAAVRRPRTLYERAPLQFWQGVAALLGLALLLSLLLRH